MAEETTIDDPGFDPAVLKFPLYSKTKIYGDGGYSQVLFLGRRWSNRAKRIDPFTRKDVRIHIFSHILKQEEMAGLIRFQLSEFMELRWRKNVCRITLGNQEKIMTRHDFECEYKPCHFDLYKAVYVIHKACLEGLIPSDFLNEEVNDWIYAADKYER